MLKEFWKGFWKGLKYVILAILIFGVVAALFSGEIRIGIVRFITLLLWGSFALKLKKAWNLFKYIILTVIIWYDVEALYLGEIILACYRLILVLFWGTMILKEKLSDSNKFISIVYYTTNAMIIVFAILELFGVLDI